MSDLLEPILRDALAKRAGQLDPAVRRRLVAVDYRPRRRRVRILPTLGAAGLAGAAVALALIFTLGSRPAPAFAGWSATPTLPRPAQTAAALARCDLGRPVLTDTRGPFTAAVYPRSNGAGTCLQGPHVSLSATAASEAPGVHARQIQAFEQAESAPGETETMLDGRVGSAVTGVRIDLSDGQIVTATVSHGWYLVWWPGRPHAATAEITSATGTQTVALPASATVGAGSCGGPPDSGCASVGPGASVGR